MTKHEELYDLYTKGDTASKEVRLEYAKCTDNPFYYLFRHRKRKFVELIDTRNKLLSDFNILINEVLLSNHGISEDQIVGGAGFFKFNVLINRTLHEVSPVRVGKRIVFFLDGIAMEEGEKATDVVKEHLPAA